MPIFKDRQQYNHDNYTDDQDVVDNDKDWKDNIFNLASNMSGLKVSDVTNDSGDIVDADNDNNDQDENKENAEYKFDPNNWWLNKDENRNDTVDVISIDEQVECFCVVYCTHSMHIQMYIHIYIIYA